MTKKKLPQKIKVTFPDGTSVCHRNAVDTVLTVLRAIDSERFHEIPLVMGKNKRRLISTERYPEYKGDYTKEICNGWYYINQSDTRTKKMQLDIINNRLSLGLTTEIGENLKVTDHVTTKRNPREKHKLIVTMPDGYTIDYSSYRDVFVSCIDQIGPYDVARRANFEYGGNPILTTTDPYNNRVRIEQHLYLAIPTSARETGKLLNLIAKRLQQPITIDLIPIVSQAINTNS
ncbi:MAG: hypothetical protein K2L05_00050 [Muribaculaceae bacterium]|nr:hypothetical protein [Muribaculaceae bacterium]